MGQADSKTLQPKDWFSYSAEAFCRVIGQITESQWGLPGLGRWDVRSLAGHTARAMLTLISYLDNPDYDDKLPINAVEYFLKATDDPTGSIHEQVYERGIEAGKALLPDPVKYVNALKKDAQNAIEKNSDQRILQTLVGPMELNEYLITRSFELTVHSLDLCNALGIVYPESLQGPAMNAAAFSLQVLKEKGLLPDLLMAVTGRITAQKPISIF